MEALIKGGVDISPVITHRFPYTQFKEAIELMKSGNSGKIVLTWSEPCNSEPRITRIKRIVWALSRPTAARRLPDRGLRARAPFV